MNENVKIMKTLSDCILIEIITKYNQNRKIVACIVQILLSCNAK